MLHFIQQWRIGAGKMSTLLQFVQDFKMKLDLHHLPGQRITGIVNQSKLLLLVIRLQAIRDLLQNRPG